MLIKLQEGFFVAIRISLFGGFILAFPMIAFQMWRFVAPGLYKNEKGAFLPFLISSPVMFVIGASFAYYAILPLAFDFFLGFQQTGPQTAENVANGTAGILFQGSMEEYLALTTFTRCRSCWSAMSRKNVRPICGPRGSGSMKTRSRTMPNRTLPMTTRKAGHRKAEWTRTP